MLRTTAFVGALLMAVLSAALAAQELEITDITIGCREEPSPGVLVSLTVMSSWIDGNSLWADLAITNQSRAAIELPARNVGGHYWDAVLHDSKGAPIFYCGGVTDLNLDPLTELVTADDVVTAGPGQTVTLRRIYLAPFWPYLREPDYDPRSFAVLYRGWSSIVVHTDADSPKLRAALAEASTRQCSLYGGELQSGRNDIPP
jgi:hypothetical protein